MGELGWKQDIPEYWSPSNQELTQCIKDNMQYLYRPGRELCHALNAYGTRES
jgi:hypothetical protein